MPAFLLSLAMVKGCNVSHLWLFGILHLLVYPASNGYNTFFDRDTGPIGGLASPPGVTVSLGRLVQVMDFVALVLTWLTVPKVFVGILVYQVASRLYSYHGVRIKALPWLSLVMVGLFQGVLVYAMIAALAGQAAAAGPVATIFVYLVASYPITQAYQIDEDARRGDTTVAMILGTKGCLVATGLLFGVFLALAWGFVPAATVLVLCLAPVLAAFARMVVRFSRGYPLVYRDVFSLVLLNGLGVVAYAGIYFMKGQTGLLKFLQ